jgi:hypothetical protein
MNDSQNGSDRRETGERSEAMTRRDKLLSALEKAITRAEERFSQVETARPLDPSSKADAAIKKLREDRRLSREELDRPVTI